MTNLETIAEQASIYVVQNVPAELLARPALVAMAVLVAGVGVSVLGAKLARPGFTVLLAAIGASCGLWFSRQVGVQDLIGGLVGAAMVGTVAFVTYRMWVGLLVGVVLSSVALGTLGYQRVVPHVSEFQKTTLASPASFTLPSAAEQDAFLERSPEAWTQKFWAFVTDRDTALESNGRVVGFGAAMIGLFLGVVAVRWTMILATSVVGAAMVTSSLMTISSNVYPGAYRSFLTHPGLMGIGVGAFMLASWIIQTLVTRRAPDSDSEASAKS